KALRQVEREVKALETLGKLRSDELGRSLKYETTWEAAHYQYNREGTPSRPVKKTIRTKPGARKAADRDPAFPQLKVESVEVDHIVTMKEISEMEGFKDLNTDYQQEVLNYADNLEAVSAPLNSSRGDTPYAKYEGHKGLGLKIDETFRKR